MLSLVDGFPSGYPVFSFFGVNNLYSVSVKRVAGWIALDGLIRFYRGNRFILFFWQSCINVLVQPCFGGSKHPPALYFVCEEGLSSTKVFTTKYVYFLQNIIAGVLYCTCNCHKKVIQLTFTRLELYFPVKKRVTTWIKSYQMNNYSTD